MRDSPENELWASSNIAKQTKYEELLTINESLRRQLWESLNLIDHEARHNAMYAVGDRPNGKARSRADMRQELDDLNNRIAKLKGEIERSHRISSLRAIEDRMRATRKELAVVNEELSVLRQHAACQRRVLESNASQQLIHSLKEEIAVEKLIHAQLRKEALAIGPSNYRKSATVCL